MQQRRLTKPLSLLTAKHRLELAGAKELAWLSSRPKVPPKPQQAISTNGSDTHYSDGEGANQSGGEKDEKHGGDSLSMEESKHYEEFKSKVTE